VREVGEKSNKTNQSMGARKKSPKDTSNDSNPLLEKKLPQNITLDIHDERSDKVIITTPKLEFKPKKDARVLISDNDPLAWKPTPHAGGQITFTDSISSIVV